MTAKPSHQELQKRIQILEARLKQLKQYAAGTQKHTGQASHYSPRAHLPKANPDDQAHKEGEAPYREMLESMNDPLFICSPQMKISYMNPTMIRLIGRNAVGAPCHEAIHDQNQECPWCQAHRVKAGEIVHSEITSPRDGKAYHITSSPIFHNDGEVSMMCIFRDITKIRRSETEQSKSRRLESIGILTGGIAHDYNNLLSVMLGNLSLAKAYGQPGSKQETYLRRIERAIFKTRDLTRRLLTFAQKSRPSESSLDLIQLAREVAKKSVRTPDIEFQFHGPSQQWPAKFDQNQIAYVIENLLINAVQAMPKGGTIQVHVDNCDLHSVRRAAKLNLKTGPYLRVCVRDQGLGIQPSHRAKVFDPYFSTRQRSTQKGMGLGLATAYAIIKNHEGMLTVDSVWKKGSTFTFYLPAAGPKMHIRKALRNQRLNTKVTS